MIDRSLLLNEISILKPVLFWSEFDTAKHIDIDSCYSVKCQETLAPLLWCVYSWQYVCLSAISRTIVFITWSLIHKCEKYTVSPHIWLISTLMRWSSESRITEKLPSIPQDFWMNFIKEPQISFIFIGNKNVSSFYLISS